MKPALFSFATPRAPDGPGLIIDNFAGGGGASTGIEAALGRHIDIAINHDPEAVAMHAANHPHTQHYCQSVWRADPVEVCAGRRVALAWFSPDCKHFSKAKGAVPVEKGIRDLAWVVVLWAKRVRPDVIMLENVEEFRTWGPLDADGKPDKAQAGATFAKWVGELRKLGYRVEHRELRASDYGAPTSRKRLFVIARCDGQPIVWPAPTHAKGGAGGLANWRTAADIIDWSVPCPSIFDRKKPLAPATLRRVAHGVMRYVVNAPTPFIVPITHTTSGNRLHPINEPLRTITTAKGGEMMLAVPTLVQVGYGEREGQAPRVPGLDKPLGAVVAGGGKHALVTAFLAQHNTMPNGGVHTGRAATDPLSTVTASGSQQGIVAASIVKFYGSSRDGQAVDTPLHTITAGGERGGGKFAEVRAFLIKYYGAAEHGQAVDRPLDTITALPRFGLVTVHGELYAIDDIGMRMLTPRELFNAQSFPPDYIIDPLVNGRPLSKRAQIGRCGNSVCPVLAEALVSANCKTPAFERMAA